MLKTMIIKTTNSKINLGPFKYFIYNFFTYIFRKESKKKRVNMLFQSSFDKIV